LEPNQVVVLTVVAFLTAGFTATIGLGGGMILLVAMLLYLEPLVAIPLHAIVQLVSNSTRTWIQRSHVRWDLLRWYALLLLPGGFLGIAVARSLTPDHLKLAIGLFVLLATWVPSRMLVPGGGTGSAARRFLVLGGVVGFFNVIVGATGPLVGPFFRTLGLPRQGVVGSFAACQAVGHVAKLVVFGTIGFAFLAYLLPVVAMSAGVVAGTWVGSRILERVEEPTFRVVYRVVLSLIALRLVVRGGLELW
jgi:uncharacterized membrane protein YfcA